MRRLGRIIKQRAVVRLSKNQLLKSTVCWVTNPQRCFQYILLYKKSTRGSEPHVLNIQGWDITKTAD
jgi:hypothetical protein